MALCFAIDVLLAGSYDSTVAIFCPMTATAFLMSAVLQPLQIIIPDFRLFRHNFHRHIEKVRLISGLLTIS